MDLFFDKIRQQYSNNLPFVMYNKPNSNELIAFLSFNSDLIFNQKLDKKGFVFAPFNSNDFIFFDEAKSEIIKHIGVDFNENFISYSDVLPTKEIENNHLQLVAKGIDAIKEKKFSKVVLSRKESIQAQQDRFLVYFKKLVEAYKTAFCYCFYHPKVGMWLGATPEQLLKVDKNIISTVALAGTQLFVDKQEIVWGQKEKEEQLMVTQFIENNLKDLVLNCDKSEVYTAQAGNLLHIKTDIKAEKKNNVSLSEIIISLHPTPAVCGLPKIEAKEFILENENYDRKYYSGFLGEINRDYQTNQEEKTDIFVNLRCMELEKNQAHLFIGGGITKESNPLHEFIETINKSQTIKKVIK